MGGRNAKSRRCLDGWFFSHSRIFAAEFSAPVPAHRPPLFDTNDKSGCLYNFGRIEQSVRAGSCTKRQKRRPSSGQPLNGGRSYGYN